MRLRFCILLKNLKAAATLSNLLGDHFERRDVVWTFWGVCVCVCVGGRVPKVDYEFSTLFLRKTFMASKFQWENGPLIYAAALPTTLQLNGPFFNKPSVGVWRYHVPGGESPTVNGRLLTTDRSHFNYKNRHLRLWDSRKLFSILMGKKIGRKHFCFSWIIS